MELLELLFLRLQNMVFSHSREGAIKLKLQSEEKDESLERLRTLLTYRQKAGGKAERQEIIAICALFHSFHFG